MAESAPQSTTNGVQSLPQPTSGEKSAPKGPLNWRKVFPKVNQSLQFFEGVNHSYVKPPSELLQIGVEQWSYSLVGRFLGKAPKFGKIVSVVNGLWGRQGKVMVSTMGSLFIFQFPNEDAMTWVLETGPWHVERKFMMLQRWSPAFTEEELSIKKMPVWVQLRRIPLQYFHPKGISFLASAIGKPLYMDRATALRSRLDYAKVCIEVEVENEIPNNLTVDLGNEHTVEVLVDTPWLPAKCDQCKVFGHSCSSPPKAAPAESTPPPSEVPAATVEEKLGMASSSPSRTDGIQEAGFSDLRSAGECGLEALNPVNAATSSASDENQMTVLNDLHGDKSADHSKGVSPRSNSKPADLEAMKPQDDAISSNDDLEVYSR
ncbi:uncharacterized protein LOC116211024 [Punica granatum]|uniref:Uncharacterized protein LOC116211024 n=1 Tax=Punica granatum TaxID=22663 RepID=A0A6P8DZY6_PUNGR|nr:uncharacterized protein LOC116211024 [Punica granatum]